MTLIDRIQDTGRRGKVPPKGSGDGRAAAAAPRATG